MKHLKAFTALLLAVIFMAGCSTGVVETATATTEAETTAEPTATQAVEAVAEETASNGPTIQITVPDDYEGELNGRALFVLDYEMPEDDGQVYDNLDVTGCPVFGKTVYGLHAGDVITMTADDPDVYGYPMQLDEIPEGEYAVQVLFVKYTNFNRSDGTSIWGMADHGGGGSAGRNPYNLYSDAMLATVNADSVIELSLTNEIPLGYELQEGQVDQQGNYESQYDCVVYDKIKSDVLSEFWGTDMYIGLNILLPVDYDPNKQYPVLYYQGHWVGGSAPLGYGRNDEFTEWWNSGEAPEMIVVTTRDANMYYDNMYWVNSANMGPCGDAYTEELIPYIEKTYGGISESWARMLAGGSNGGWESMALQLFYPEIFGGSWVMCPDGMDFHAYQIVNLYDDDNGFYIDNGWTKTERPSARDTDGNILWTIAQENHWETAMGGGIANARGCWSGWEAVYGPVGEDGYPQRVWDPITGEINKDTVAYWQKHFDLNYYLQNNWDELSENLIGKLHLRGGDMDNYYLNLSQYLVTDFLETTEPYYDGYSVTFPRKGHTGNISNKDLLLEMVEHMEKYGPSNAAEILGVD